MYIELPDYLLKSILRLGELNRACLGPTNKENIEEIDDIICDIVFHVASAKNITLNRSRLSPTCPDLTGCSRENG